MRKVIWTAAVLALCAAPAAAQQIEKSPFTAAREQAADVATPSDEPAQEESKRSLHVSPQQMDETIRAVAAERGESRQMNSNFWYTVAAIALGIIIASLLLN